MKSLYYPSGHPITQTPGFLSPAGTLIVVAGHVKQPSIPENKQEAQEESQAIQILELSSLIQPGLGAADSRQGLATHSDGYPIFAGYLT